MKILKVTSSVLTGIILCIGIYGVFFDGNVNTNLIMLGVGIVLVITAIIDFNGRYKSIRVLVFTSGILFVILGLFNFMLHKTF
ncbi:MAG TPA: hypothetical protein VK085_10095 [Pseudogracilibacillus sp.]|nr:hypothetical protein [Pseudogracilibacillus sp.]